MEIFLHKHIKNYKIWHGGEDDPLRCISKSAEQTKKSRKIAKPKKKHDNKSRPIFSEAPQTEWRELTINFPTRSSGFPM